MEKTNKADIAINASIRNIFHKVVDNFSSRIADKICDVKTKYGKVETVSLSHEIEVPVQTIVPVYIPELMSSSNSILCGCVSHSTMEITIGVPQAIGDAEGKYYDAPNMKIMVLTYYEFMVVYDEDGNLYVEQKTPKPEWFAFFTDSREANKIAHMNNDFVAKGQQHLIISQESSKNKDAVKAVKAYIKQSWRDLASDTGADEAKAA